MPFLISLDRQMLRRRGYAVVLVLVTIGLGACIPQPGVSNIITSVERTPTTLPSPTKPLPPPDWPYRWLQEIPCRAPCWEGITPGQTTAVEAVEILRRSPLIATVEVTATRSMPETGAVRWSWVGEEGKEGGWAEFHAQTPSSPIYAIYPMLPAYFRLGDVIQSYGEPSHIVAKAFPRPHDDGVDYTLGIIYRAQGFVLNDGGPVKPILNAEKVFGDVIFFAPTEEGFRAALPWEAGHPKEVIPWQGMKDFDYYCTDIAGNPCP